MVLHAATLPHKSLKLLNYLFSPFFNKQEEVGAERVYYLGDPKDQMSITIAHWETEGMINQTLGTSTQLIYLLYLCNIK